MKYLLVRLVLIWGGIAVGISPALAQYTPTQEYYKYEQEEVRFYRQRIDFQLPEMQREDYEPSIEVPNVIFPEDSRLLVEADPRLEALINLHKSINEKTSYADGYRVQIYFGSVRNSMLQFKNRFYQMYPDVPYYPSYVRPNNILRVGDFMRQDEADRFYRELRPYFNQATVVPDRVKVPKTGSNYPGKLPSSSLPRKD